MKKLIVIIALFTLVGVGIAIAGEQLDLSSPINISAYRVVGLNLDWDGATIVIFLKSPDGHSLVFSYVGTEATNLMTTLNKIDLTVKSLQRRILEKLSTDGKLVGTVSGTPD